LKISGVPVGEELLELLLPECGSCEKERNGKEGSIIIVLATDAPLLPHQLARLVRYIRPL
jgi:L-aminopeptidase/D-esterase-like protein